MAAVFAATSNVAIPPQQHPLQALITMREHVRQLLDRCAAGQPTAYCRLVETRGSTPQKAGAMMLVFPDGTQAGTLGGGCVEAEVKRKALAALQAGEAEIARFQLDSDYGWDDGLICGGRMDVLIEPLDGDSSVEYFQQLESHLAAGTAITEAIVFDEQAAGLPVTAAYLFDATEELIATLHAPTLSETQEDRVAPQQVMATLRPVASRPRAYAAGGISYLPVLRRCRLVIVGGGHVGQAVAQLAADLEFDVWVVDDREGIISEERFPRAQRRIVGAVDQVLPALDIRSDTYCLIVTRGHNHDEEALYYLCDRGAAYVGLIGSRRKIRMIFNDLLAEGIAPEVLDRVYAPLGIDIGSQTVPEIAVSIAAELVSHRNRGVVPGRPDSVSFRAADQDEAENAACP